jgi:hypothetical protein
LGQVARQAGQEVAGEPFFAGGLGEEQEGGAGLAVDALGFEEGQSLAREGLDFAVAALGEEQKREVDRDGSHVEAVPLGEQLVPHLTEKRLGELRVSEREILAQAIEGLAEAAHLAEGTAPYELP